MSLDHSGWALDCKVYIGGLGSGADKEELEREFRCYGNLKNVWVARNPPGFAFIEYTDPRDAEDAVRALDGILMNGRRIMVQMSTGKTRGRSGLTRSRSRSRSPYGRSRSPSPHRKYRHRSRSRRSFSYGTSRSRSGSRSEDSYRNYSRSRRHKKRGTSSRHYHSSYSRSRSRSRSCGSDTSTEYTPQRRRRSYSLSSHSRCSSISRASSRVSSNRSQSRHRTRSRSQSRCSDSPGPIHSQVGGVESKQRTPHGRSQSRSRSKSSSQSRSRTPIGRVQNRIGGSRLSREKNTSDSRTLCRGINRRSSIDETDSGDIGKCQCSSADIKSDGDVLITSEVAVQTDPYLLLHFVQKCPEILSETFLRLDRDNVLNNCNYPEVIPSVHQRAGRLKTSSERYRNNELVS